ncbi:MAG: hypothetical protein HC802_09395 [Caldilineaceae bacterium]|nr:hypothetical protein [Caldilineaceae bacterium]
MHAQSQTIQRSTILAALLSLSVAALLWIGGYHEQGFFAATWAPAIASLGAYILVSRRREEQDQHLNPLLAGADEDARAILSKRSTIC